MVFIVLLLLLFNEVQSYGEPLYSSNDPIWLLDSTNFDQFVLCKDHFWVVEFYNKWCGHCVRFAPTWKEFARSVKGWKNIIKVAAVDCSDDINVQLCRNYKVTAYPTVKVFNIQSSSDDPQYEIGIEHNVTFIKTELINILTSLWHIRTPLSWPSLLPVRAMSINQLWRQFPNSTSVTVILEDPSSIVGREVIMYYLKLYSVLIFNFILIYIHDKLFLVSQLSVNLILFFCFLSDQGKDNYREAFLQILNPKLSQVHVLPDESSHITISVMGNDIQYSNNVYMGDLENALNYSLRQEVGVHEVLRGEKLNALKDFISILIKYFPGRLPIMRYLNKLYLWILEQKSEINVEKMMENMVLLQSKKAYLPPRRDWQGCKGSKPGFRGYPCSLWMLFHTLTVQAYYKYQKGIVNDSREALFAIRGYVKYFFTCADCSEHFQNMASNMENELQNQDDTILWLWKAHNRVNGRLADDLNTNDPRHPKVQFPPTKLCPECRDDKSETWNIPNVLKFLGRFYGRSHIVQVKDFTQLERRENHYSILFDDTNVKVYNENRMLGSWRFRYFNGMDISLCIMLYIVSAVLMIILYFLFALRRRKYRAQKKTFVAYP
ncbi:sulfhydryl oxidase 2-like [Centruroides sculpturatus]|uniref:sulfhydryl oxidase 2-like n=1 Tax=Centruroides sculpturatus TaxID=218467 RepID=UPI000C6CEC51|nr:sulfhydryl oxidase 2-like [Centruroides sculpturatus]